MTGIFGEPRDSSCRIRYRATVHLAFLALGDSYTIGEAVEPAERWPVRLSARLRDRGIPIADPEIIARTGWTTAELAAALQAATLQPPYRLVTLLIGVNDQYRGLAPDDAYRARFERLLARAVDLAAKDPARLLVLSIPDWGVTPFAAGRDRLRVAAEIDAFNAINESAARAAGAAWLDVTPISREAARDPALVAPDGLHPSAAMYERWVERARPLAEAILRRAPPQP